MSHHDVAVDMAGLGQDFSTPLTTMGDFATERFDTGPTEGFSWNTCAGLGNG
jgi:hypothetical protein